MTNTYGCDNECPTEREVKKRRISKKCDSMEITNSHGDMNGKVQVFIWKESVIKKTSLIDQGFEDEQMQINST